MNDVMKRIEILRIERDMKAKDIYDAIGVDKSTYATWKNKDRTPDANNIVKIANTFGVSTDFILKGEEHFTDNLKIPIVGIFNELNEEGQELLLEYGEFLKTRYIKSSEAKVV